MMKKFLGIIVLGLLLSGNAYAKYELITSRENGNTYFLDIDTKKSVNNFTYIWSLVNIKNNNEFKSAEIYLQFDCKIGKQRQVTIVTWSDTMRTGNAKVGEPNKKWLASPPGSVGEDLFKETCK